ncbi:EAL domain-containing protein [Ferrimicrobium sp.]|uniref:bifunctional diguanylate cyclase/phosphodiesterase n=1 Tax=Ferrimicrobium sp. TaxID=2926050 RepID=UPI0026116881|nr:EAL domain-containing protein [Ferrimicrobium sp.]
MRRLSTVVLGHWRRWAYAMVLLLVSVGAIVAASWSYTTVRQTVTERSRAAAVGAADDASAHLTRDVDAVAAQMQFVGLVAFHSPSNAVTPGELSMIFTRFAQSSKELAGLALISDYHRVVWSYGELEDQRLGSMTERLPGDAAMKTGRLRVVGGRLHLLIDLQIGQANAHAGGSVVGELVLESPLARADAQSIYLLQRGSPTLAITAHNVQMKVVPSAYVVFSSVQSVLPDVKFVAGISSKALSGEIRRATTGPLVVIALAWLVLVGLGFVAVELIYAAKASQVTSRESMRLAELHRRLSELVLTHKELGPLFQDVCTVLQEFTEAQWVIVDVKPEDAAVWGLGAAGTATAPSWLRSTTKTSSVPSDGRAWIGGSSPTHQRLYRWGFGVGASTIGDLVVMSPSRATEAQIQRINLDILDVAIERASVMAQRDDMAAAVKTIDVGVAIFGSDGLLRWANRCWYSLLGVGPEYAIPVRLPELVAGEVGQEVAELLAQVATSPGQKLHREVPLRRLSDQSTFWASLTVAIVADHVDGSLTRSAVVLLRDATEAHESTESLQFQLEHDSLTGTLSRAAIEAKAAAIIAGDPESNAGFALAILDVDNFKLVNDTWGHAFGDELLAGIGHRLQENLGAAHSVGRFGGDEFVLIFCLSSATLAQSVEAVRQALDAPFAIDDDLSILVHASMGIAQYPTDAVVLDQLLREADRALYHVKTSDVKTSDVKDNRWWLSRSELEVSESTEYDPWSAASTRALERCSGVFATLMEVIEMRLRERLDPSQSLPLDAENNDWVRLHCRLLKSALDVNAVPASLQTAVEAAGAELEIANADRELLSLSSSIVTSAILDDRVGPMIAGRERRLVVELIRRRFDWVVEYERVAMAQVRGTYLMGAMGAPLQQQHGSWDAFLEATLDGVVGLPGVRGAVFSLSRSQVVDGLGYLGGDLTAEVRAWLSETREAPAIFDLSLRQGPGDGVYAWETNTIVRVRDALVAEQYRPWRALVKRFRFRSLAIVPIMAGVEAVGLCTIFGSYTNQFEGRTPDEFLAGLQHTLETGWTRLHGHHAGLTGEKVQRYRKALSQGGLREHLQPLLDLTTGTVTRAELLARLKVGGEALALPGEFLPALGPVELTRLFVDSLRRAIEWHQRWGANGLTMGVSINVPADVLGDARLREELAAARMGCDGDLSWLMLELLESDHLTEEVSEVVKELAAEGFGFAIDDLGAGYSNLGRLVDLPLSQIKLDRSIVQRLWSRPLSTLAIVDSVIQAGHEARRTVVLEGIERFELLEVAAILRADYAQGFAIARPMPSVEFGPWVQQLGDRQGWSDNGSTVGVQVSSTLGAIAYIWREVHRHGDHVMQTWGDCPVEAYLGRTYGVKSPVVVLHRRLHAEGLIASSTYHDLLEELDRRQRALLSGDDTGSERMASDGVTVG